MKAIEARLKRLEARRATGTPLPRLFLSIIDRDPVGFVAMGQPDVVVRRLPGESVADLEARCAEVAPAVFCWRSL